MTSSNILSRQLTTPCETSTAASSCTAGNCLSHKSSYYQLNIDYNPGKETVQLHFLPKDNNAQGDKEQTVAGNDARKKHNLKSNATNTKEMFKPVCLLNENVEHITLQNYPQIIPPSLLQTNRRGRKRRSKIKSLNSSSHQQSDDTNVNKSGGKDLSANRKTAIKEAADKSSKKHENPKEFCEEPADTNENAPKKKSRHKSKSSKRNIDKDDLVQTVDKMLKGNYTKHKAKLKEPGKMAADCQYQPQTEEASVPSSSQNQQIYFILSPSPPFKVASSHLGAEGEKSPEASLKSSSGKNKGKRRKKRIAHPSLDTKYKDVQNTTSTSCGKLTNPEKCLSNTEIESSEMKKGKVALAVLKKKNKKTLNAEDNQTPNKNSAVVLGESKNDCSTQVTKRSDSLKNVTDTENSKKAKKHKTKKNTVSIKTKNSKSGSVNVSNKKQVDTESVDTIHAAGDAGIKLKRKSNKPSSSVFSDGLTHGNSNVLVETKHNKNRPESKSDAETIKNKHTGLESKKTTTEDTTIYQQRKHSRKRSEDKQNHNEKNFKIGTICCSALVDHQAKNLRGTDQIINDSIEKKKHKLKNIIKNEPSNKSGKDRLSDIVEVEKLPKKRKKQKRSNDDIKKTKKGSSNHSNDITQDTSIAVASEKHHKKSIKSANIYDVTTADVTEASSTKNQNKGVVTKEERRKSKSKRSQTSQTNSAVNHKTSVKSILKSPVISVSTVDPKQEQSVYSATTLTSNLSAILESKDSNYSDISSALELIQILQQQPSNAGRLPKDILSSETVKCLEAINQNNKIITKRDGKKVIKITKNQLEAIINKINETPCLKQPINKSTDATVIGKPKIRKEVSFSELNLKPVVSSYQNQPTPSQVQPKKFFEKLSFFTSPKLFASKEKKETKYKKRNKVNDHKSILSEAITKREKFQYVNGKRYPLNRTIRNFAYSENIIEKSIKTLRENGSRTLGFTVEGIEPPKMLKSITNPPGFTKKVASKFQSNLHVTVMSIVDIQPNLQDPAKKIRTGKTVDDAIEEKQRALVNEPKLIHETDKRVLVGAHRSNMPIVRNRSLPHDKSRNNVLPITRRSKSSSSKYSKQAAVFGFESNAKQSSTEIGPKMFKYQQWPPMDSERKMFTGARKRSISKENVISCKENLRKTECASFDQTVNTKMNKHVEDYGNSSKDETVEKEVIRISRNAVCKTGRNEARSKATKSTQSSKGKYKINSRKTSISRGTVMDKTISISEYKNIFSVNDGKNKICNNLTPPTRCKTEGRLAYHSVPSRENTFKQITDTDSQNPQIGRGSTDSMTSEWSLKYNERYPKLIVCKHIENPQPSVLDDFGKPNSLKENQTRKKKPKLKKMSLSSSLVNSFSTVSLNVNCSATSEGLSKVDAPEAKRIVLDTRNPSMSGTENKPTITVCQNVQNLNSTAYNNFDKEDSLNPKKKSAFEKLTLTGALVSTFSILSLIENSSTTSETKPKPSETNPSEEEQKAFGVTQLLIASSKDDYLPEVPNASVNLSSVAENLDRKKKNRSKKMPLTNNNVATNLIDNSCTPVRATNLKVVEPESTETENNVSEMGDISLARITEEESLANLSNVSQLNANQKPNQASFDSGKRLSLSEAPPSFLPILKQIDHKMMNSPESTEQNSKQIILYKQFRVRQEVNEKLKTLSRDVSQKIFEIVTMASNHILELQDFTLPKRLIDQKMLRKSVLNVESYCLSDEIITSEIESSEEEQLVVVNLTSASQDAKKLSANAKGDTSKSKSKTDQKEHKLEIGCSALNTGDSKAIVECHNKHFRNETIDYCLPTQQTGDNPFNKVTKELAKEISSIIDNTSDSGGKLAPVSFNDMFNLNYTKTTIGTESIVIKTEPVAEIVPKIRSRASKIPSSKKAEKSPTRTSNASSTCVSQKLNKSKTKRSSTRSSKASSSSDNQGDKLTKAVKNEQSVRKQGINSRNESDALPNLTTSESSFKTSNTSDFSTAARVTALPKTAQDEKRCKTQDMSKSNARSILNDLMAKKGQPSKEETACESLTKQIEQPKKSQEDKNVSKQAVNKIIKQDTLTKPTFVTCPLGLSRATQYSLNDISTYPIMVKRPSRSSKTSDCLLKKTEENKNKRDRSSNLTTQEKSTTDKDSPLSKDVQKCRSSSKSRRCLSSKAQEEESKQVDRMFEKVSTTSTKATQYTPQSNYIPSSKIQHEESVEVQLDPKLERRSERLSKASSKKTEGEENKQSLLTDTTFEQISTSTTKGTQYTPPSNETLLTNATREDCVPDKPSRSSKVCSTNPHEKESKQGVKVDPTLEKKSSRLPKASSVKIQEEKNNEGSKNDSKSKKLFTGISEAVDDSNIKNVQDEDSASKQSNPILEKRPSKLSRGFQNVSKMIPEEEYTNAGLIASKPTQKNKAVLNILSEVDTSSFYENKSTIESQASQYSNLSDESQLAKIQNKEKTDTVNQPDTLIKSKLDNSPTRTSRAVESVSLKKDIKSAKKTEEKKITDRKVKSTNERDILFDSTSEKSSTKTGEASDNASELIEANSHGCVRKHFFIKRKTEACEKSKDNKKNRTICDYVPKNVIPYQLIDVGVNTDARDVDAQEISRLANLVKSNVMKELRSANLIKQNRVIGKLVTHNETEMKQIDEIVERNIAQALKQTVYYVMRSSESNTSQFEIANTLQGTSKDLPQKKLFSISKIDTSVSPLEVAQRQQPTFKETSNTKACSISKIRVPSIERVYSPKPSFTEASDLQLPSSSKIGNSSIKMSVTSQQTLKEKTSGKSSFISKIGASSPKLPIPTPSATKEVSEVKLSSISKTVSCPLETSDALQHTLGQLNNISKFREWSNMRLQKNSNVAKFNDAQRTLISKPKIENQTKQEREAGESKTIGEMQGKSNSCPANKDTFNNQGIYEVGNSNPSRTSSECQTPSAKHHESNSDVQQNREQKKEAVMEKVIALIAGEPDFQFLESRLDKLLGLRQESKPQEQHIPSSNSQVKPSLEVVANEQKTVPEVKPFSYQKAPQIVYAVSTTKTYSKNDSVEAKLPSQTEAKSENKNFNVNSKPNDVPKPCDFRGPFKKPEPIKPRVLKPLISLTPKSTKNDLKPRYLQRISKIPKLVSKQCSVKLLSSSQSESINTHESKLKSKEIRDISIDSRKNSPILTNHPEESLKCLTNFCEGDLENADSIGSKQSSISKFKKSSCLYTKVFNKGRPLTTHEKRKQYGERIRYKRSLKSEIPVADNKAVNNKCRCYCEEQIKSIVSEMLEEHSEKILSPPGFAYECSNLSASRQSKTKNLKAPSNITEPQDALDTNYYNQLDCCICNKLGYGCTDNDVFNTTTNEDKGRVPSSTVKTQKKFKYSTLPTIAKPERSSKCLRQKQQYKSAPLGDKEDRIYQAFNVTADHPHVTAVFKNKFKSTESSISLFSRESLFSCENYLNYISPNKSSVSCTSANIFSNKTVNNSKSSSLPNTNCSDDTHQLTEESKRFANSKRMVNGIGARLRKRNFGRRTTRSSNRNFSSTNKEFFNTIEQNSKSIDGKKATFSSPLTVTPSFEFCHSTPEYRHQDVESACKLSELSHKNRPRRITRRNVSLLEACQQLKNRPLTLTENYGAASVNLKGAEPQPSYSLESSKLYSKNDEDDSEEYCCDKYKNVNRKTFFKDTKSLIYQNLEKSSNKLKSVPERKGKSNSPDSYVCKRSLSHSSNDNRRAQSFDKGKSTGKKYKMTKVCRRLNQSTSKHKNDSGAEKSEQPNQKLLANSQTKSAHKILNNSKQRRIPKFFKLKKDNINTNKLNMKSETNKQPTNEIVSKQSKVMKKPVQIGFGDNLFRNCNSRENIKTEDDSDLNFSFDEDIQTCNQRSRNSDTEESGDCFKVFAYNNVIELDMDYQPLFATDYNKSSQAFGLQNLPKSKLFRCNQFSQADKRSLKDIFYGDNTSKIPATATSDITESGYESYISKNSSSLRKFFTPEESVLDKFTAAFKCFDEEVCNNDRAAFNSLFVVNAFPVSTSGKCSFSRPCTDSGTTDSESRPSSSRQQKQTSSTIRSLNCDHFPPNLPDEPCTYNYDEPSSLKPHLKKPDSVATSGYEVDKKRQCNRANPNTGIPKDMDKQHKKSLETPVDKTNRRSDNRNKDKEYSPTQNASPTTKQNHPVNKNQAPQDSKTKQREIPPTDSKECVKRSGGRIRGLIQSISKQFHTSKKFDQEPDDFEEIYKQNQSRQKPKEDAKETKLPQLKSCVNSQTKLPGSKKKDAADGMPKPGGDDTEHFDYLRKQVEHCHEYAEKVCKNSKLREQGLHKQFLDFTEIPLCVLLGKKELHSKDTSQAIDDRVKIVKRSKNLSKIRILDEDVQPIEKVSNLKINKNSRSKRSTPKFMRTKKICSSEKLAKDGDSNLSNSEGEVSNVRSITSIHKLLKSKEKCCSLFMEVLRRLYEESNEPTQSTSETKQTTTPYDIAGVSESLKKLSRESEMPLKEALDMIYAKMLENVSGKNNSSISKTNSQKPKLVTCKNSQSLLEKSEQSAKTVSTIHTSKQALISLKELLDMIFGTILQGSNEEEILTQHPSLDITLEEQLTETYIHPEKWMEESKELIKNESGILKKLSKESLHSLKKVLDMAFEKILHCSCEDCVCDSPKEIIDERLLSANLLEKPQKTLQDKHRNLAKCEPTTLNKLSINSLNPLRELLDKVFEKILQGTSDDSCREFSPSSSMELEQLSSDQLLKKQLEELTQETCKNRISLDKQLDEFIRSEATSLNKLSKEALNSLRELLDLVFQKILQGTSADRVHKPSTELQRLPLKILAKQHVQELTYVNPEGITKESLKQKTKESSISLKELLETVFEKFLANTSEKRIAEPLEELSTQLEIPENESPTTLKKLLELVCSKLRNSKKDDQFENLANLRNCSEQSSQQSLLYASELSQQQSTESSVGDIRELLEESVSDRDVVKESTSELLFEPLEETRGCRVTTSENIQKSSQLTKDLENGQIREFPKVRSDPIKQRFAIPKEQSQQTSKELLEIESREAITCGNLKQIPELDKNMNKVYFKKLPNAELKDSFKESLEVVSDSYGNIQNLLKLENNTMRESLRKSSTDQFKYSPKELSEPSIYSCATRNPKKFPGKFEIEAFSNLFQKSADKPLQGRIIEDSINIGATPIEPIDLSKKSRYPVDEPAGVQRFSTEMSKIEAVELESTNATQETSKKQEDQKLIKKPHKSLPKVSIEACETTTCTALANLCKESTASLKDLFHTILENALLNASKESIHNLLKEVLWESFEKASELPVKLSHQEPTKQTSDSQLHRASEGVKYKTNQSLAQLTINMSIQEYALRTCKHLIRTSKGSALSLRQLLDVIFEMILSNAPKECVSKLTKEVLWDSIKELFELPLQSCTIESCKSCKSLTKFSHDKLSQVSSINISDLSSAEDVSFPERSMKEPSRCDNLKQLSQHLPIPLKEVLDIIFEKLLLNISAEPLTFLSKTGPKQLIKAGIENAGKEQSCTQSKSKELLKSTVKELSRGFQNIENCDFVSTLLKTPQTQIVFLQPSQSKSVSTEFLDATNPACNNFRNLLEQPSDVEQESVEFAECTCLSEQPSDVEQQSVELAECTCLPKQSNDEFLTEQSPHNQLQSACTECSKLTCQQWQTLFNRSERQGPPNTTLPGCTKTTCEKLRQPPKNETPSLECTRATCKHLRSFSEEGLQNLPCVFETSEHTPDISRGFKSTSTPSKQVVFEAPMHLVKKSSSEKSFRKVTKTISKESREQLEKEVDMLISTSKRSLRNISVCLDPAESFCDEQKLRHKIFTQETLIKKQYIESKRMVLDASKLAVTTSVQESVKELCTTSTNTSSCFLKPTHTPDEITPGVTPMMQKQFNEPEVCTRSTFYEEPICVAMTPAKERIQKLIEVYTKSTCMTSSFQQPTCVLPLPVQKQIKNWVEVCSRGTCMSNLFQEPLCVERKQIPAPVEVCTKSTCTSSSFQAPANLEEEEIQESVELCAESGSVRSSFQEPTAVVDKEIQASAELCTETTSISSSFQEPTCVVDKEIQESAELCAETTSIGSSFQEPTVVVDKEIQASVELCTETTSMGNSFEEPTCACAVDKEIQASPELCTETTSIGSSFQEPTDVVDKEIQASPELCTETTSIGSSFQESSSVVEKQIQEPVELCIECTSIGSSFPEPSCLIEKENSESEELGTESTVICSSLEELTTVVEKQIEEPVELSTESTSMESLFQEPTPVKEKQIQEPIKVCTKSTCMSRSFLESTPAPDEIELVAAPPVQKPIEEPVEVYTKSTSMQIIVNEQDIKPPPNPLIKKQHKKPLMVCTNGTCTSTILQKTKGIETELDTKYKIPKKDYTNLLEVCRKATCTKNPPKEPIAITPNKRQQTSLCTLTKDLVIVPCGEKHMKKVVGTCTEETCKTSSHRKTKGSVSKASTPKKTRHTSEVRNASTQINKLSSIDDATTINTTLAKKPRSIVPTKTATTTYIVQLQSETPFKMPIKQLLQKQPVNTLSKELFDIDCKESTELSQRTHAGPLNSMKLDAPASKKSKISFRSFVELCKKKSKSKKPDVMTEPQLHVFNLSQNPEHEKIERPQKEVEEVQDEEDEHLCLCPSLEEKDSSVSGDVEIEQSKSFDLTPVDKPEYSAIFYIDNPSQDKIEPPLLAENEENAQVQTQAPTVKTKEKVSNLSSDIEYSYLLTSNKSEKSLSDMELFEKLAAHKTKAEFDILHKHEATDAAKNTTEKRNALKKLRESLTDKELFEKLLNSYEKEEQIVDRLSNDVDFFQSQLELVKSKESIETLFKDYEQSQENVSPVSEEQLISSLNMDSSSDYFHGKFKNSGASSAKTIEVSPSVSKKVSKSKLSGFKAKMTRLFKTNDGVKEIVAPREDDFDKLSLSLDGSLLNNQSSELTTQMAEETRPQIAKENSQTDQKVKFSSGSKNFQQEKKMLDALEETANTSVSETTHQRTSIDSTDSNIVRPVDLGNCFLRGFRSDYVSLNGNTCLYVNKSEKESKKSQLESVIDFSERDTPLEYLLALGFSIDEASNAIKDEDVKNRLYAAITEARIWINQISTVQGTLLYLIAYKAKPKTMRYFLQLVEAIINRRINNAVKLNAFLRLLEKVEDGDLNMINVLGSSKFDDEENEEKIVKKQLRQLFINVYKIAEHEANLKGKPLSKNAIILLRILAAKYRAGLHPHLELIARYIGQGLLKTEVQLEAAMIYLSRLDTADVNLKEFEQYCAIKCKPEDNPVNETIEGLTDDEIAGKYNTDA